MSCKKDDRSRSPKRHDMVTLTKLFLIVKIKHYSGIEPKNTIADIGRKIIQTDIYRET